MHRRIRNLSALICVAASLPIAACGHASNKTQGAAGEVGYPASATTPSTAPTAYPGADTSTRARHHSQLKGALVGAAAGHVLGHHALAGAAAGALIQHERNKRRY